jgi:hypothetical protein
MAKVDMALFAYHFQWRKSELGWILYQSLWGQFRLSKSMAKWTSGLLLVVSPG